MSDNPYLPHPAPILDCRPETGIDRTYRVVWRGAQPQAGQFFQVSLPRVGEAPISASGWGDGWIDLTIRNVGHVTAGIFGLAVGDRLHLRGPYGTPFPAAEFAAHQTIVAAGGTGLAPVRGLIERLVGALGTSRGPSALTVLAGFRSPGDVLFASDLKAWAARADVRVTVDRAGPEWTGHTGVITALVPDLAIPAPKDARVVVVGPPLMMKYTVAAFLVRGIIPEHLWVSHERRMSCGVGKCGHCKIMNSYVCTDGPVYRYADAQWLMD